MVDGHKEIQGAVAVGEERETGGSDAPLQNPFQSLPAAGEGVQHLHLK